MQTLVRLHGVPPAEAPAALWAPEGLSPAVPTEMGPQAALEAEASLAVRPPEGLLPRVNSDVFGALAPVGELPLTVVTGEWLLPGVCPLVGPRGRLPRGASAALRTLEGCPPAVHPQVLGRLVLPGEPPATLPAGKPPLPSGRTHMLVQGGFGPEGPATLRALEGPRAQASHLVQGQAAPETAALLARAAPERLLTRDRPEPPELRLPPGLVFVLRVLTGLALAVVPSVLHKVSLYLEDLPTDKAGIKSQAWWNFQAIWGSHWLMPWIILVLIRCCDVEAFII